MIDLALDNRVIIHDKLDAFIQEIDILFNTSKTELIGNTGFGSSFLDYLWEMKLSTNEVIQYAEGLINQCYYSKYYTTDIQCEMIEGDYREIYLLQITIYYTENGQQVQKAKKIYQFK